MRRVKLSTKATERRRLPPLRLGTSITRTRDEHGKTTIAEQRQYYHDSESPSKRARTDTETKTIPAANQPDTMCIDDFAGFQDQHMPTVDAPPQPSTESMWSDVEGNPPVAATNQRGHEHPDAARNDTNDTKVRT